MAPAMSGWQVGDLALCIAGEWEDADGFPLDTFPPSGPTSGQVLKVEGLAIEVIRDDPRVGLHLDGWGRALFDARAFRRIPPLTDEETQQTVLELQADARVLDGPRTRRDTAVTPKGVYTSCASLSGVRGGCREEF